MVAIKVVLIPISRTSRRKATTTGMTARDCRNKTAKVRASCPGMSQPVKCATEETVPFALARFFGN